MIDNPYQTPDQPNDPPVNRWRTRVMEVFAVVGIIGILIALLLPATRSARPAARRTQCLHNLKQVALALQNYHDVYDSLPPAYTVDANGRPLHSWRTLILPYLDQQPLYKTVDLTKPWDDPANASAFKANLNIYQCPSADLPLSHTTYMGLVAANGRFLVSELSSRTSESLLVIEVSPENSVHWMAPQDEPGPFVRNFGPNTKLAHAGGTQAAFADGTARFLVDDLSAADRQAMMSTETIP